jgi:poly-gamma-glutamate capsule biosynthesis protein CapA/YwtB (metallophosphatase superfamily)
LQVKRFDIVCSGDLVLDEPDPDHWLSAIAPAIRTAALAIGHLEVPHTRGGKELSADVPAPGAPPEHVAALSRAGFDAVTLAGNHIADCGAEGIRDTLVGLDQNGIAHTGAAMTLALARAPAWLTCRGVRVALLSYNCVGPEASWATSTRAGCAYIRIATEDGGPIAPASKLHQPDPASVALMEQDVGQARSDGADICIVALHKGIVHVPARLAPYERPIAWAAVDAGADVVIGHHAHILRGFEFYRGRPIFHGLGNGCVVTRALSPDQAHPSRAAWARRRRELFGFEPDPAYPLAPFHPEAVHGLLARVVFEGPTRIAAGFLPLHFEPPGRPVLATGATAEAVCNYLLRICHDANLPPPRLRSTAEMIQLEP